VVAVAVETVVPPVLVVAVVVVTVAMIVMGRDKRGQQTRVPVVVARLLTPLTTILAVLAVQV